MKASAALFLILSPFLTWITVVSVVVYQGAIVFGWAAQSDLLMVSSNRLGTNISDLAATGALLSMVLLIAAGIAMLKSARLGVPIAMVGLAAYVVPIYSVFGTSEFGLEQTFISPGIGLFVATTGVALGSLSFLSKPGTLASLAQSLRTRRGLSKFGVSMGVVGLSLDVTNHTVLGQLPDFIGSNSAEWVLRLGLVAAVALLFVILALGPRLGARYLAAVSFATLALLSADAIYSMSTGNLHDFLGHNLTGTVLHLSVYYGAALTAIAALIRN